MEEEIEHLKELKEELSYMLDKTKLASETYFKYHRKVMAIEFVLSELKRLQKGINSLMQSRKKWKDRYYKLKTENTNTSRELLHRTDELNDSIPKQVIRNKIEELENTTEISYGRMKYVEGKISILKELLGG